MHLETQSPLHLETQPPLHLKPQPPLQLEENAIYCGDAVFLLSQIPDSSVDLVICDGPYGVTTHAWDQHTSIQEFNLRLIAGCSRILKEGGAMYLFGKHDCIDFVDYRPYLNLRRRIIWYQPSRLAQGRRNYTNNYDVICYFLKGAQPRCFNLEAIRVPQLVELEHRKRCERVPSVQQGPYAKTKYNEQGKNPGDVWGDIKQLTYRSKELLSRDLLHTIQKPERLIERLVLASSNAGDLVLDLFAGAGTCPVVCKRLQRRFLASEADPALVALANQRLQQARESLDSIPSVPPPTQNPHNTLETDDDDV
ncbi:hypothetical protein L6R29_04400 [Myxococcota bacterium]|nr:hypothetical protein [Myxococcota bacterium]